MALDNTHFSDERVLIFKTTKDYSTKQVSAAFVFLILGSIVIYFIIYEATDAVVLRVIVIIGLLVFFWNIIASMRAWFTKIFTLEIDQDHATGRNLFGKEIPFHISDVISVKKLRTWKALQFKTSKNRKIEIAASIDFSGFIYDYILLKAKPEIINENQINKLHTDNSY